MKQNTPLPWRTEELSIAPSPKSAETAEVTPQELSALAVVPTPPEPDYSSLGLKKWQQLCREHKPWRTSNLRFNSTELIAILQGKGAIALPPAA